MNPEKFHMVMKFLERVVEDDEDFECKYCEESFKTTELLKTHSITVHTGERRVCDFCLKEFWSPKGMLLHLKTHMHIPPTYKPKKNKQSSTKKITYYKPETESESDDSEFDEYSDEGKILKVPDRIYPRKCDHCNYEVPQARVHYHHYLIMHSDILSEYPYKTKKIHQCSFCGLLCSINHIKDHEATHLNIRKVKCTECEKHFKCQKNMVKHRYQVHPKKMCICDYCSKEFKTRNEITRHIRTHTGDKPFKCPICGAGFAHSGNRQVHILSAHQNVKKIVNKRKGGNKKTKHIVKDRKTSRRK